MIPIQQSFDSLRDILELLRAQRKNAAKSIWADLNADFRKRVMSFLIYLNTTDLPKKLTATNIASPFGDFTIALTNIDKQTVSIPDLTNILPEVL